MYKVERITREIYYVDTNEEAEALRDLFNKDSIGFTVRDTECNKFKKKIASHKRFSFVIKLDL